MTDDLTSADDFATDRVPDEEAAEELELADDKATFEEDEDLGE